MEINKIVNLIEIDKKRAENEFKKSLGLKAERIDPSETPDLEIVYPMQDKIDDTTKMLEDFTPEQIKKGLRSKSGQAYELLRSRGKIVKANYENRLEIAKLCVMLAKLDDDEKEEVKKAIRLGSFENSLKVASVDEEERRKLARFLCRCGITCSINEDELSPDEPEEEEVSVKIENTKVWVGKGLSVELEKNLKKMNELGSQLQVSNAKRHIMEFNEEEEKIYTSRQQEYLDLLKKRDELLKDFKAEMSS